MSGRLVLQFNGSTSRQLNTPLNNVSGLLSEICGWGRYPRTQSRVTTPATLTEIQVRDQPLIARGQGRSYGDAAQLTNGKVLVTEKIDRVINFDQNTGLLEAEAGMTLEEILDRFSSGGWFPAVVPGTKFV